MTLKQNKFFLITHLFSFFTQYAPRTTFYSLLVTRYSDESPKRFPLSHSHARLVRLMYC
jgi:hypothetical protein